MSYSKSDNDHEERFLTGVTVLAFSLVAVIAVSLIYYEPLVLLLPGIPVAIYLLGWGVLAIEKRLKS